jgi:poly(ADP-ribose) glycohydrolase ARH3
MTLALASSLVHRRGIDPAHCAKSYAYFFKLPPERGYGRTTKQILECIDKGADYRDTGTMFLPAGSFANGGVMRISPVGLVFRNAPDQILHQAVTLALKPTHTHAEGIDGAWLQAKLIGWLVKLKPENFKPDSCIKWLITMAKTDVLREKLTTVERGIREKWDADTLLKHICTPNAKGKLFQIHAAEAFACSVWNLLRYHQNPEEAIIHAVSMGGDSDTIGAITGAQVGALYGTAWVPRRWFDQIENFPETGRDVFIQIGRDLAALDSRSLQLAPWPKKRSIFTQFRRPDHSP